MESHDSRIDVLREHAFLLILHSAAGMRLAYTVGFNALVFALLLVGHASWGHFVLQALLGILPTVILRRTDAKFIVGMSGYLVSIANTGGLASPLLLGGPPLLIGVAMSPLSRSRKLGYLAAFLGGLLGVAALGFAGFAVLPEVLRSPDQELSGAYVALVLLSAIFATVVIYRFGARMFAAQERTALELAERREEICRETEDRTRALEGIAARLAHEVKNPLAAIKGLSAHMARSTAEPRVAERLTIVEAEATRLQAIVDGFLSFSRGLDDLKVDEVHPNVLAKELALLLGMRAEEARQTLEVQGSDDVAIEADGRKLRQAMMNLVLNAMQASPEGSVVTIETAANLVGAATIRIIDRGEGMSADVLARLAKPYYTTKVGGSGLGVAVARGLIEQHGGSLTLESQPGRGTVASIRLPAKAKKSTDSFRLPNPAREKTQGALP